MIQSETKLFNIIYMHSICFPTDTGEMNMISKLRYLKCLETFTKGNLSVDIRVSRLQSGNYAYNNIVDSLEQIVDLCSSGGGWIAYGWVNTGLINDVSLLGNDIKETGDNKVLSQNISTHVVHIHPSKRYYRNLSTIQGRSLNNLKFNFSTLQIYYCNKSYCGHVIVDLGSKSTF